MLTEEEEIAIDKAFEQFGKVFMAFEKKYAELYELCQQLNEITKHDAFALDMQELDAIRACESMKKHLDKIKKDINVINDDV